MASSSFSSAFVVLLGMTYLLVASKAQLTPNFYSHSCPQLFCTVRSVVESAIMKEARMGASLLRLFFHDCFVNGCDASILLDDTSTFIGEKNAIPNKNSLRGFEVIDQIKTAVEKVCPGTISCADILAITARDSIVTLGGPAWTVKLGRRDARTASQLAANNNIPPPTLNLTSLISNFQAQGLSATDLSNIDASFVQTRRSTCPNTSNGSGDTNLAPLDVKTPTLFDNSYYNNLINKKGLLHSDQQLFSGGSTDSLVQAYNSNPSKFNSDFVAAMIKMGDIKPLTGSNGEIRKNCRKIN
ncbi:hypothetical protein Cgig2_002591 [Carnegiea gigantea]|uniref:Peroxidase n=1 Tax=Carnegiea gigantea TaxID=171969 RepID=A0A9Q1JIU4_9CARY|nr:hypothetical protein Cgig2_002591 [Carnegiea gigantea]